MEDNNKRSDAITNSTQQERLVTNRHQEDERSLLDVLIVFAKYKRVIFGIPLLAAVLVAGGTLLLPNWYTATAKLLPPQQSQSNAVAILGQLGALTGGASQALGIKNPSDIFVAMLKSRTVADHIVEKFDLKTVYDEKLLSKAGKALKENTSISAGRDGVITIEVDDKNPVLAANVANEYVSELEQLTLRFAVSEAGQRRLFFEKRLVNEKQDLANAEIEMQKLQERTGIVNPSGQASLSIAAAAGLRAQITAKEVQLTALQAFATEQNPDLVRAERELQGLREQLGKMEKTSQDKGDVLVGIGRVPGASIEFIKKYRDVKYHETLFELLAKQYEIAKIDEAKDATLIQVLDKAIVPDRKSSPKRALIVIFSTIVVFILTNFVAFGLEWWAHLGESSKGDAKRRELLKLLRRRRATL